MTSSEGKSYTTSSTTLPPLPLLPFVPLANRPSSGFSKTVHPPPEPLLVTVSTEVLRPTLNPSRVPHPTRPRHCLFSRGHTSGGEGWRSDVLSFFVQKGVKGRGRFGGTTLLWSGSWGGVGHNGHSDSRSRVLLQTFFVCLCLCLSKERRN